jgi:hypothetical protein
VSSTDITRYLWLSFQKTWLSVRIKRSLGNLPSVIVGDHVRWLDMLIIYSLPVYLLVPEIGE